MRAGLDDEDSGPRIISTWISSFSRSTVRQKLLICFWMSERECWKNSHWQDLVNTQFVCRSRTMMGTANERLCSFLWMILCKISVCTVQSHISIQQQMVHDHKYVWSLNWRGVLFWGLQSSRATNISSILSVQIQNVFCPQTYLLSDGKTHLSDLNILKTASAPDTWSFPFFILKFSTRDIWLCDFYYGFYRQHWQVTKLYLQCCQTPVLTQHLPVFVWDECLFNYMNINVVQQSRFNSMLRFSFTLHWRGGLDYSQQVTSTACSGPLLGVCLWLHAKHLLDLLKNREINMRGF